MYLWYEVAEDNNKRKKMSRAHWSLCTSIYTFDTAPVSLLCLAYLPSADTSSFAVLNREEKTHMVREKEELFPRNSS